MKAYLKNEIGGTDFIELQKGKYKNLHFKEDSIYFCEEDFIVFELIISVRFSLLWVQSNEK